jgi:NDP-sugar pyrophosphorylase family protein
MQAVILAAGLGTRLRPITERRSKAMVPVVGRPLVEMALAPIVASGVRDVVMVVGPDDEEIREHFGGRSSLEISVHWVTQEERLGMAHALGLTLHLLDGPFLVSACDSLVSEKHIRDLMAAARSADTVLSLLDVDASLVSRSAAVELDGDVVRRIVEKPTRTQAPSNTVSLPHYIFSPLLAPLLSQVSRSMRGEYELQDAIQQQIEAGARVVGVRAKDRVQVSSPGDLLALNRRILNQRLDLMGPPGPAPNSAHRIIEPVHIEAGARLGRGCTIGPETFLESGCVIGDRAVVRGSVVLRGARVADGREVVDTVVVG